MERRDPREIYTLRHFLFYLCIGSFAGAGATLLASLIGWSDDLALGVGVVTTLAIVVFALRETLFEPARKPGELGHRRHS